MQVAAYFSQQKNDYFAVVVQPGFSNAAAIDGFPLSFTSDVGLNASIGYLVIIHSCLLFNLIYVVFCTVILINNVVYLCSLYVYSLIVSIHHYLVSNRWLK